MLVQYNVHDKVYRQAGMFQRESRDATSTTGRWSELYTAIVEAYYIEAMPVVVVVVVAHYLGKYYVCVPHLSAVKRAFFRVLLERCSGMENFIYPVRG